MEFENYSNKDDLKNGYYGHIYEQGEFGKYTLLEIELAEPGEDGWECADWYLADESAESAVQIAKCDGYTGVEWLIDDEDLSQILTEDQVEDLKDSVTPFRITGDLMAEAQDANNDYIDDDDNYNGPCMIWVEYCYSSGTLGAPSDKFLQDDRCDDIWFESVEEAKTWIDEAESETYYLAHGEMGRPTYRIVRAD